jgi:uncharacterized membrane protein YhdT
MAVVERRRATALPTPPIAAESAASETQPVVLWAVFGGLFFIFMTYVGIRWVAGSYFKRVAPGPTPLPGWEKAELIAQQAILTTLIFAAIGWFFVRPLVRERRITTDGLLVLIFPTFWFDDPLSAYFGHWFTYNAWMFNRGSWVSYIPGWMSYGSPGHTIAEPILWDPGAYVFLGLIAGWSGCWMMRKLKARRPQTTWWQLCAACFVFMMAVDVICEVGVFMRLRPYAYPGGTLTIFGGREYQYTIWEMVLWGGVMASIAILRYFRNDRGETYAERGFSKVNIGGATWKRTVLRYLALFGALHFTFLVYNVMFSIVAAHEGTWPASISRLSYMTDGLCGAGTNRACPGAAIPIEHGGKSFYISPTGKLIAPPGAKLPAYVPFSTKPN